MLHVLSIILGDVLQHLFIQHDIKFTSTQRCDLTKHDIFSNTSTVIQFTHSSGFHKNFYSFFKRTSHQGTCFSSIDTMTGNSHKMATVGHDITK
jgi:hypothetical protein